MRFGTKTRRMNIRTSAREQHADIRNVRRSGEHQRERPGDFGDGSKASFTDGLQGEPILDEVRIRDHADYRSRHCSALVIPSRYTSTRRPLKRANPATRYPAVRTPPR